MAPIIEIGPRRKEATLFISFAFLRGLGIGMLVAFLIGYCVG